jgi:hypothetical protein
LKKANSFFIILISILLVGCSTPSPSPIDPTSTLNEKEITTTLASTATPTETPAYTPTLSASPTSSLPPFRTPTPSAAPSPTPDSGVSQNCLPIQPALPQGHSYNGKIIFDYENSNADNLYYLYNPQRKDIITITNAGHSLSVSPDHTQLAYVDLAKNRLVVLDPGGEQIASVSWRENWGWIDRWLDNQRLLITMDERGKLPEDWKIPQNMVLLNPFTGQSQTLYSQYPEIHDEEFNPIYWPRVSITIYSPDLKRVVYPGVVYPGSPDAAKGYILYGILEQTKLAQIPNWYWQNPPMWSYDGTKFIMEGNHEFYLVSYDGTVTQVTHMNPERNTDTENKYGYYGYNFLWSPDNQHVAFWLTPSGKDQYTLAVLNTESGEITDYCIPAGRDRWGNLLYPLWSPDGKNLLVAANFGTELENDVLLIDRQNKVAYKLPRHDYPAGWLVAP